MIYAGLARSPQMSLLASSLSQKAGVRILYLFIFVGLDCEVSGGTEAVDAGGRGEHLVLFA